MDENSMKRIVTAEVNGRRFYSKYRIYSKTWLNLINLLLRWRLY